jgi:outer membrane protein
MKMMKTIAALNVLMLCTAGFSGFALAQDGDADSGVGGHVMLGAGMAPEYEGSEDYKAIPLLAAKVQYDDYYIETRGLGARANISSIPGVEFGPAVSFKGGRDDDVENEAIANMREIDDTVEAGAFVKIPVNQVLNPTDELAFDIEFMGDVGGEHEGYTVGFGPSYSYMPTDKLRLGVSAGATYASEDYNDTYFGVDADNAARSGLDQYQADGGIKDVGVGVNAMYSLDEHWGVTGLVRYEQLVGDAADSPIVDDEGSAGQGLIAAGVSYRF